jgi:hypothetical protein
MRRDKMLVLMVFVLAVASAVGFQLVRGGGPQADAVEETAIKPSSVGEFRGISLQLHDGRSEVPYEEYIDEIARTGANTICLVVSAYQENCASTSIFIDLRKTPTDERLKELAAHAHAKGLRVALMPIVLLENPREGEWRGKIAPANWEDWWEDYENYVLHYAWIAESIQADIYLVGSELVSTEDQADRWRGLIRSVRGAYKGRLSYSANWDHYDQIAWWSDLDIVGMTTYHDLSGGEEPTLDVLMSRWEPIRKNILDWQKKVNRPILFTEIGWPNQTTCAQYPWDYYRSNDKPDPQAQANCFEAFFRTWLNDSAVTGCLVWEWRSYPGQVVDPDKDTSYVPCGKPAEKVISDYFKSARTVQQASATGSQTVQKQDQPHRSEQ